MIKVLFQNPVFLSTNYRNPDFLVIKLRPALLVILKSQSTQLTIFNPLQTYKRRVPKQVKNGLATENLKAAAYN